MNDKAINFLNALEKNAIEKGKKPSVKEVAEELEIHRSTAYRYIERYLKEGILDDSYRITDVGRIWMEERKIKRERLAAWMSQNRVNSEFIESDLNTIMDDCSSDLVAIFCNAGLMCQNCQKHAADNAERWFGLRGSRFKDKLGQWIRDGDYAVSFTFYKDKDFAQEDSLVEVSMANRGFLHPGILRVHGGEGTLLLKRCMMRAQTVAGIQEMGQLERIQYVQNDEWKDAEIVNDVVALPISAFWLSYEGEDCHTLCGRLSVITHCPKMASARTTLQIWAVRVK